MNHSKIFDKSRLDLLIYAQDGRGLGHVSRSAAIGMAIRRLYPGLKVLLITGFRDTQMLLGESPLDWIKLPAYETRIIDGKARGKTGDTNLKNCYLGPAREFFIESIIKELKPRCIIVDHLPLGRKDELASSQILTKNTDTKWILGIRSIPGGDKVLWSAKSQECFKKHFGSLLWYGDEGLLGPGIPKMLSDHFDIQFKTMGYVSRYKELTYWQQKPSSRIGGVISIPWLTDQTIQLLDEVYMALNKIGDQFGPWHIYTKMANLSQRASKQQQLIETLPFCKFRQLSDLYFSDIQNAKVLISYGGYNSLSDIMAANIPSVVITRDLYDKEQDEHVEKLQNIAGGLIYQLKENVVNDATLSEAIIKQAKKSEIFVCPLKLDGAAETAHFSAKLLNVNFLLNKDDR